MATLNKTVRSSFTGRGIARQAFPVILSNLAGPLWSHVPVHFAHWPDGRVFLADGLNQIYKWDGLKESFYPVGITAPSGTPTIAGSGSGSITGTYRIYVRFLDADGTPSPLGTASADTAVASVATLTFSSLPTPTDQRVVKRQILRNTAGQLNDFYVDVETTDLWSTSLTSTQSDTSLANQESVALSDPQTGLSLSNLWDPPRTDKPYIVAHRSRLFAGGEVVYARGNVQVTQGSVTVTGIGTNWTSQMVGRTFIAIGSIHRYEVATVTVSTQTLTLTTNYLGPTNLFAAYMIRTAPAIRTEVYYSEAGNPEGWPDTNVIEVQELGEEVTALIHSYSYLYIAFRERIYKLTFDADPAVDGSVVPHAERGCVGQRAWVMMNNTTFVLDHLGVYALDQAEELAHPIRDLFSAQSPGKYKIDWTYAKYFHACADPENATVRFFVSLTGPTLPHHAICYHVLTQQWWIEEYPYPVGHSVLRAQDRDRVLVAGPGMLLLELGQGKLDGPNPEGYNTTAYATAASVCSVTCPAMTLPASGYVGQPIAVVKGMGKGQMRLIESFDSSTGKIYVNQPWLIRPDTTSILQVGAVPWTWRSGWYEEIGLESAALQVVFTPAPGGKENPATQSMLQKSAVVDQSQTTNILNVRMYLDHLDKKEVWKIDSPFAEGDLAPISFNKDDTDLRIDLTHFAGFAQVRMRQLTDTINQTGRYTSIELGGFSAPAEAKINAINIGGTMQ